MRTFLIILLGTLSLLLPRSGWSHDLYFRHYTNKQGLSHNTVYCALQDKKGFMWFGTDDGLNRFDGHQFRIYRYNSYEPESLPNDRIISLFEDSTGRIWVCTYSHTCYYDYQTDAFHPLTFSDSNNAPEYFQPIREDKNIYQGFDFTGDHDPNRQPVWVLGGTYSSENKMLPYLHSGKCYFQFAKYAP